LALNLDPCIIYSLVGILECRGSNPFSAEHVTLNKFGGIRDTPVHGGTLANKSISAPANADGFYTPLSSLPEWANNEVGAIARKKGGVRSR